MPGIKRPHAPSHIRLPLDVKAWLRERAAHNFSTQNAEIVYAIRALMAAEKREASEARRSGQSSKQVEA
jgi:hypothetical protein